MMNLHLECGLPKSLKAVTRILAETDVPQRPETLVRSTVQSTIYAVGTEATVFGRTRSIAVYRNTYMTFGRTKSTVPGNV